jgi:hypothetical protein
VPLLIAQGIDDDLTPYDQVEALKDRYCAHGTKVAFRTTAGGHDDGFYLFNVRADLFIAELFRDPTGRFVAWTCR